MLQIYRSEMLCVCRGGKVFVIPNIIDNIWADCGIGNMYVYEP